jgi:hypothetical protein
MDKQMPTVRADEQQMKQTGPRAGAECPPKSPRAGQWLWSEEGNKGKLCFQRIPRGDQAKRALWGQS